MATTLETLLNAFVGGELEDPHDLREWATRHRALPVTFDMGGFYAIRLPDEVVSCGWDDPEDVAVESNAQVANGILYRAALIHPSLAELVPARPAAAIDCPQCQAVASSAADARVENLVCSCGGLGWVPAEPSNTHPEPDRKP